MNSISQCRPLLGTFVEIDLEGPLSDEGLIDLNAAAFAEIERIEKRLSFHDAGSELSRINREGHREPQRVSEDLATVLSLALELSRRTAGSYDISIAPELAKRDLIPANDSTRQADPGASWRDIDWNEEERVLFLVKPMSLDLGGIAKGYAVDRAIGILTQSNVKATVNAGGDLRMSDWQNRRVVVRHPDGSGVVELDMRAPALATSALSFREEALIDATTRQPIRDERSVSVFAQTCMLADALTKVAFLAPNAGEVLREFEAQALSLSTRGEVMEWQESESAAPV